jgi:hypothetical protein
LPAKIDKALSAIDPGYTGNLLRPEGQRQVFVSSSGLIFGISGCPVMVVIPGQIIDGLARERIGSGR